MNESQLRIIVKALVDIRKENKELLREIRNLKKEIEENFTDIISENKKPIGKSVEVASKKKVNLFTNNNSPLASIFSDLAPIEDSETPVSILDEQVSNDDDAVSRVMNKIHNTDYRRVLNVMENASANKFLRK
jgi:cell division septum initiation protein DivIVA